MRKMLAGRVALACCLCAAAAVAAASCGGARKARPDELTVEGLVLDINLLADQLVKTVEAGPDPGAGVDNALRMLELNSAPVRERLAKVRASQQFRESEEARGKLLECEVDTTDRISKLRTRHLELWQRDASFKARLDRLVAGYQDIFK